MLEKLFISNYALIDSLDLQPGKGLSIITGETGAGKSIMLGALGLLMGDRADTKAVGQGGSKAVVEAVFTSDSPIIRDMFAEEGWDWDDSAILLRREISSSGKSRAFVNDTPVKAAQLRALTLHLIDIHSQHQTLLLSDADYQLQIVDAFSDNLHFREEYGKEFKKYRDLYRRQKLMLSNAEEQKKMAEFLDFQLAQLDKLKPQEGEQEALEKEFEILNDAEAIKDALGGAYNLIYGSEEGILSLLLVVKDKLSQVDFNLFYPEDADDTIAERLDNCYVELKDVAETLYGYSSQVTSDAARMAKVEQRLNALYTARRNFKVADADALALLYADLKKRKREMDFSPEDVGVVRKELAAQGERLKEAASLLTESRKAGAAAFSSLLEETARPLGLDNLKFCVSVTDGKLTRTGKDVVEFLCAFNKNQPLMPMARIASGGEASRLMLSVKAIMASKMQLPTIVFDEVDTGVSGEIADRMGSMMKKMASEIQVLAITHLPQVASKGKNHFKVYKEDSDDKTVTRILHLSDKERIDELARMLSGANVGEEARRNARALLKQN